jgi:hypothetical protein
MGIFSVMHIFAFDWKPYRDVPGLESSGYPKDDLKYKGGPMGFMALLDAMNPWDMAKAGARGLKWLVVGRKNRHSEANIGAPGGIGPQNPSYNAPAYDGRAAYGAPQHALSPYKNSGAIGEEGHTLLHNVAPNPSGTNLPIGTHSYNPSINSSVGTGPDSLPLAPEPGSQGGSHDIADMYHPAQQTGVVTGFGETPYQAPVQKPQRGYELTDTGYHGANEWQDQGPIGQAHGGNAPPPYPQ